MSIYDTSKKIYTIFIAGLQSLPVCNSSYQAPRWFWIRDKEASANRDIRDNSLVPIVLQGTAGDVEMGHHLLDRQIAFAQQQRFDFCNKFVGCLHYSAHILRLPVTIRHTSRVLLLAALCCGTKIKRSRMWLTYKIVCFNLRNLAQQKRSFEKDLLERKTTLEPFVVSLYVSICSGEFSFLRSLPCSVYFAPQCISMLQYKSTIYFLILKNIGL